MNTLIYRNKETTTFTSLFNQLAVDYSSKLTFVTREEYLEWVKKWKEDYKIVDAHHKITKLSGCRDSCVLPKKIEMYQKRLDNIVDLTPEQLVRLKEIEAKYLIEFNLKPWFISSHYLVWYMLIIRKAGKLRAANQRELQQKNKVAA